MNVLLIAAFHNNVVCDECIINGSLSSQRSHGWMYDQQQPFMTTYSVMNALSIAFHNNAVKINVLPIAAFYYNVVIGECIINSSLS